MTAVWHSTQSPYGDGLWFALEHDEGMEVIAAPGVRVLPAATEHQPPWIDGWRAAVWAADDEIAVDLDPPVARRTLSTAEVVACVGPTHSGAVERVMIELLLAASSLGQGGGSAALQDTGVQASVSLVLWIRDELDEAFPGGDWAVPRPALVSEVVPDTFEEFMERFEPPDPVAPQPRAAEASSIVLRSSSGACRRTVIAARPERDFRAARARRITPRAAPPQAAADERLVVIGLVLIGLWERLRVALRWVAEHGAGRGAPASLGGLEPPVRSESLPDDRQHGVPALHA